MKCVICRQGETRPGKVVVTLQRAETTVILKGVPADICENCREYYLSGQTAGTVLDRAEAAVQNGAEVEILQFAAQAASDLDQVGRVNINPPRD